MRVPQLLLPVFTLVALSSCTTNQDGVPVISDVDRPTPAPPAPRIITPEVSPKSDTPKVAQQRNNPSTSPPPTNKVESSSGQSTRSSLEEKAKEFARNNGGQLPSADQVGELANKIDGSTIEKATSLLNEHKDQLPNKAELQRLIDQLDPATIDKAKKALEESGLLETIQGQIN